MWSIIILLLFGLHVVGSSHGNNPPPPPPPKAKCTTGDISSGNIDNCICEDGTESCHSCPVTQYGLKACDTVCNSQNQPCSACDIYYGRSGICGCLQEKNCIFGKTWNGQGNPPIWILRPFSANLISSPVLNTGVEQLSYMPDKNDGWILGLNNMNKKSQALTLNSKHSRSRNQIHIHICSKNSNAEKTLTNLDQSLYSSFNKIVVSGVTWYCKNANNGLTISSDVVSFLGTSAIDTDRAGVGVLTDSKGRLWNCISTSGAAEYIFCN